MDSGLLVAYTQVWFTMNYNLLIPLNYTQYVSVVRFTPFRVQSFWPPVNVYKVVEGKQIGKAWWWVGEKEGDDGMRKLDGCRVGALC